MKLICSIVILLVVRQAIGAVVRKPPAFSTPMYSDSYLPAAMQVIFHAVEQLKLLEAEETSQNSSISSSTLKPMLHTAQTVQTSTEEAPTISTDKIKEPQDTEIHNNVTEKGPEISETSPQPDQNKQESVKNEENLSPLTEISQTTKPSFKEHQELPEVNEETPETNYATPETNYEAAEEVHEVQETNQEAPEEVSEKNVASIPDNGSEEPLSDSSVTQIVSKDEETQNEKKKMPTVDSIVEEIYEIVKPTPSEFIEEADDVSGESKSPVAVSVEKMESIEEEEEDTRFTLLGEKVAQVPRPSLSSYLRRTKVPTSPSLQQLASLYDALSKDARKQGYGKYTGYTDQVLKILESSAEGGVGPQLKQILQKVVERNELTREDAKSRTAQALRDLDNPGSLLAKDMRRLLPLRYSS